MGDGALQGRPNHGRFGRPFRALTTNGSQPRALPWAIFGRPVGALAMTPPWVVERMVDGDHMGLHRRTRNDSTLGR